MISAAFAGIKSSIDPNNMGRMNSDRQRICVHADKKTHLKRDNCFSNADNPVLSNNFNSLDCATNCG
ncbi:hypothetical protein Plhal304r1_c047g0129091 [Plasmopara halstedii]